MFTKQEVRERIAQWRAAGKDLPPFNLACFVAVNALAGKRDKAGNDYAYHMIRVAMESTNSGDKHTIGILHDVVEDSDWTLDDLRDAGFSERVVAGVDGMTRRVKQGELYFDFIVRCGRNPDSLDRKLVDLADNQNQSRNDYLVTDEDRERLNKYILSYNYLVDIKKNKTAPGTPFADWMRRQGPQLQDWELLRKHSRPFPGGPAASPAP